MPAIIWKIELKGNVSCPLFEYYVNSNEMGFTENSFSLVTFGYNDVFKEQQQKVRYVGFEILMRIFPML